MSWTAIMKPQPLFQNAVILRELEVDSFSDIITIAITFIKIIFKNSIIVKRIVNHVLKCNFLSLFLEITKILNFLQKMLISKEQGVSSALYNFLIFSIQCTTVQFLPNHLCATSVLTLSCRNFLSRQGRTQNNSFLHANKNTFLYIKIFQKDLVIRAFLKV